MRGSGGNECYMKFDYRSIEDELRRFWKDNRANMHYYLQGKEVFPEKVSSCNFQLKEVEPSDDYNFEVTALNLSVQIDCLEAPYKANFLIKVAPELTSDNTLPKEKIVCIYNNRINLKK